MQIQVADKNDKVVSIKGTNTEQRYFVTHLPQHNQTIQTKRVQIIILYLLLMQIYM